MQLHAQKTEMKRNLKSINTPTKAIVGDGGYDVFLYLLYLAQRKLNGLMLALQSIKQPKGACL